MAKKVLFIDRDGTMIKEPQDEQIDSFEKLIFYPKCIQYLSKIAKELDYELVMITNQDGLGTEVYPEDTFGLYTISLYKPLKMKAWCSVSNV